MAELTTSLTNLKLFSVLELPKTRVAPSAQIEMLLLAVLLLDGVLAEAVVVAVPLACGAAAACNGAPAVSTVTKSALASAWLRMRRGSRAAGILGDGSKAVEEAGRSCKGARKTLWSLSWASAVAIWFAVGVQIRSGAHVEPCSEDEARQVVTR